MSWCEFFILVVATVFGSSVVFVITEQRLLLWNGEGVGKYPVFLTKRQVCNIQCWKKLGWSLHEGSNEW